TAGRQLFAEQLLGASLMAAPAALVIAKMFYPETEEPLTKGNVKLEVEKIDANGIDAAASGAGEGLKLALNVGAMLLAFIALLAMFNSLLGFIGASVGLSTFGVELTIQKLLGWVFSPVAYLIGIEWADATQVGTLLGTKLVLT